MSKFDKGFRTNKFLYDLFYFLKVAQDMQIYRFTQIVVAGLQRNLNSIFQTDKTLEIRNFFR